MPRRLRFASGGYVYHVLNRAVGRASLFRKDGDYEAFEKILREAPDFQPLRLLAYCLMPNQWHLVLWPKEDGDLSRYVRWVSVTHTRRYHAHYHSGGTGPIYQGRFKSFPVQEGGHLRTLVPYVERNALRAGMASPAEAWRGSSLWQHLNGTAHWLSGWPAGDERPALNTWARHINEPETEAERKALRIDWIKNFPI